MSAIKAVPDGDPINIERAQVVAVKADFVKNVVRITLNLALDEHALAIRKRLALLAWDADQNPVNVEIQPLQMRLIKDEEQTTFQMLPTRPPTLESDVNALATDLVYRMLLVAGCPTGLNAIDDLTPAQKKTTADWALAVSLRNGGADVDMPATPEWLVASAAAAGL